VIHKIGTIRTIINDLEIVIESDHSPQSVITFDSVLCLADHTPIGRVDDIFGAVKKPHYFVRLTVDKAVALKDKIAQNMDVYAVQSLTKYAVPPQTDERYSSESECDDDDDSSSNEDYGPNRIDKLQQQQPVGVHKHKYPKRRKRTMSVDRGSVAGNGNQNGFGNRGNRRNVRRYGNGMGYGGNKRQRYSNPYVNMINPSAYYSPFGALPTAIPPPTSQSALMQQTASMFRPQVNIIPSMPMHMYSNAMMYQQQRMNAQQQQTAVTTPTTTTTMVNEEEKQKKTESNNSNNVTVSTNPFSFGKESK